MGEGTKINKATAERTIQSVVTDPEEKKQYLQLLQNGTSPEEVIRQVNRSGHKGYNHKQTQGIPHRG